MGGRRHSRRSDAEATSHHEDVGDDVHRLVPGESTTCSCACWRGSEVRDVRSPREHHGRTPRARVARLGERRDDAVALVGERRAQVWRLHTTGSAVAFDSARRAVVGGLSAGCCGPAPRRG